MSAPIITVENLSKRYHLGQIGATTLRESAERFLTRVRLRKTTDHRLQTTDSQSLPSAVSGLQSNSDDSSELWALRDVSFEVQPGEVLGIIGRNGAGKSTLLKILSRITEPTSGRAIIRGRVASLLEVGTGFHPELSGRENIFLNGAILGMKKAEIARKFDEIVAFSEVERFIDTPVKRYSSGMYVRLAFAVAAHLDPEILIVDEVLAVGDAGFQKKCIGKIGEVAHGGRTVLFVSHSMTVVCSLCTRAILLEAGCNVKDGDAREVAAAYVTAHRAARGQVRWTAADPRAHTDRMRFIQTRIVFAEETTPDVEIDKPFNLEVDFELLQNDLNVSTSIHVFDKYGLWAFCSGLPSKRLPRGRYRHTYCFPANLLNDGPYTITLILVKDTSRVELTIESAIAFTVHESKGREEYLGTMGGCVRPLLTTEASVLP
jgi:lipopolysaccharide transport system ATP-binding protein